MSKYYITKELGVQDRYTVSVGPVDSRVGEWLWVAPEYDHPGHHIVFAGTGGDPAYLATLDDDGEELHRTEEGWITEEDLSEVIDEAIQEAVATLRLDERSYITLVVRG